MAYSKITLELPDIKKSFGIGNNSYSNSSVKFQNVKMIQQIDKNYGKLFSYWGGIFDIPKGILIGFCATESGGTMVKPNRYKATGLMQVTPSAIFECATKWRNEVSTPLPIEATNILNAKVPTLLNGGTLSSLEGTLLNLLTNDANFNIMSGSLVLRWLLERFSTFLSGGQLNKVMVAYNAGAYTRALGGAKANKMPIDSTTLSQNSLVPKESKGYLIKMLGIDGFLALIYKDKVI
jgi:soluble lytic murein transglycosylase-like protein